MIGNGDGDSKEKNKIFLSEDVEQELLKRQKDQMDKELRAI
ncbi:MAG: hypothetical protein ACK5WS_05715 [Alphaproteobacteria bacterium]|jgi:hypothetical protein